MKLNATSESKILDFHLLLTIARTHRHVSCKQYSWKVTSDMYGSKFKYYKHRGSATSIKVDIWYTPHPIYTYT